MKCDNLQRYSLDVDYEENAVAVPNDDGTYMDASEVDATIAELQSENAELKKKLMPCLNGDCILTCEVIEKYGKENAELKAEIKRKETVGQRWFERCMEARTENVGLERAIWLARAERYRMKEFIAREEGNLSSQMSWSRVLRERTYNQWVDQLLRIAYLANKLQNKCLKKAEEYK